MTETVLVAIDGAVATVSVVEKVNEGGEGVVQHAASGGKRGGPQELSKARVASQQRASVAGCND
jgi:hypothetical protein